MPTVNWLDSSRYMEDNQLGFDELFTEQYYLVEFLKEATQKYNQIWYHDPEVSDDQPTEHLRVLDDSPDTSWDEFFEHTSPDEHHRVARKEQEDGATLFVVRESYPGVTALPPVYLLGR